MEIEKTSRSRPIPTLASNSGTVYVSMSCRKSEEADASESASEFPERFAQEALGHNSKAVHRAYARRAQVKLHSLESCERQAAEGRIIQLPPLSSEMHTNGHRGHTVG